LALFYLIISEINVMHFSLYTYLFTYLTFRKIANLHIFYLYSVKNLITSIV